MRGGEGSPDSNWSASRRRMSRLVLRIFLFLAESFISHRLHNEGCHDNRNPTEDQYSNDRHRTIDDQSQHLSEPLRPDSEQTVCGVTCGNGSQQSKTGAKNQSHYRNPDRCTSRVASGSTSDSAGQESQHCGEISNIHFLQNVKEHATPLAGAGVERGAEVHVSVDADNRAASGGCCVSACSASVSSRRLVVFNGSHLSKCKHDDNQKEC